MDQNDDRMVKKKNSDQIRKINDRSQNSHSHFFGQKIKENKIDEKKCQIFHFFLSSHF